MNNTFELSEGYREKVSSIASVETTNFSELVKLSELSKSEDFRGANLSEVDFSNSDLRGFDFTGADLSRTRGTGFKIDQTTILTNANVSASVLAMQKERFDFFNANPEHYPLFKRLKNEYWTTGSLWIGDNLKRTSKNYDVSSKIAKFLYSSVRDQTYKNSILYAIKYTFEDRNEYKNFLLDQIIDPEISYRSLRNVIEILARGFSKDTAVRTTILSFLTHDDAEIRKLCVSPVVERLFFVKNKEAIVQAMMSEPESDIRKLYCQNAPTALMGFEADLLFNEEKRTYHDYRLPIDDKTFMSLVRGAARRQKVIRKSFNLRSNMTSTVVTFSDLDVVLADVNLQLSQLAEKGLPLELKYKVGSAFDAWLNMD
ncbi:hypothetical protein GAO09_29020 [Rhizobiales bacterium RZME27]|uniref:Pentapeptide repeat-containing protein n=1 Tax=Endobacterium cereale TaxID=2663029 RepID=A0A6A8AJL2_9HYPH|nr:pentapeptide repeat-containing protein [Endobacterium cereale]MQY50077.1 hypothetical protein [Endobacterium cereale]